jgi:hypothetical protein
MEMLPGEGFLIFYSQEDKCWIAHSLKTDQFGTGDCVVDALVDGIKAVEQVLKLAKRRSKIKVQRDAPKEIINLAKKAAPLPRELFEIAHKRLYGQWPAEIKVYADTPHSRSYSYREPVTA